ncbi:MAG: glycoside hydrolase family 2 protein [Crocinitomicaceae bacterium]|nr:glycoside hydrolase family 2 protein [Crocinitomicaceae bacterium]
MNIRRGISLSLLLFMASASWSQEDIFILDDWYLYYQNDQPPVPVTVPGSGFGDLLANENKELNYTEINEHKGDFKYPNRYICTYFYDQTVMIYDHLDLVFEGLDTYAKIYLNDSLLLQSDNMFRQWEVDLKDLLNEGTNYIEVVFESPIDYHAKTLQNQTYQLPSGNENVEQKVAVYSRKAAYQFGWDWCPRLVTHGIWKPCYIRAWNDFRITNFIAHTQSIVDSRAMMQFKFHLFSDSTYQDPFYIEMMGKEFQIYIQKGTKEIAFYHEISDAKLWWPNGYGDHPLYSSTLNVFNHHQEKIYTKNVSFAIRTVELVNEKDSIGTSFYFKVNGKPIFMKGANYVPQHLIPQSVSNEQTEWLLETVQQANMNMLRVWGGGIYESDFFYNQCDLRGIMVWQDFMFANSMVPSDSNFRKTVSAEIHDQMYRLRNHACIALWCGNNEVEVAWQNWGWHKQFGYSSQDSTKIIADYQFFFHQLIPNIVKELDPSRSYISSSPQSNWGKPENFNHGAMHYWGVWHGREPIENYQTNVGRFMVEYGFQSYPLGESLSKFYPIDSFKFDSESFKKLQLSYIGNGVIQAEIEKHFGVLSLNDWLLASQYIQAQAYKTAIIAHRLKAPHCMGTLLWQLNDCWPGASWSLIDFSRQKKLAFYMIEKWYAPTIAVIEKNKIRNYFNRAQ